MNICDINGLVDEGLYLVFIAYRNSEEYRQRKQYTKNIHGR